MYDMYIEDYSVTHDASFGIFGSCHECIDIILISHECTADFEQMVWENS